MVVVKRVEYLNADVECYFIYAWLFSFNIDVYKDL